MISKIAAENPCCVIITDDINCRSPQWWDIDTTKHKEGRIFEPLTSDLGFGQLISDGVVKVLHRFDIYGQPNLFLETGAHLPCKSNVSIR